MQPSQIRVLIVALCASAGGAAAAEFTVPGPSGESLKFYLESPLSPVSAGDTIVLTGAGVYQTTYTVSDADLTIKAAGGQTVVIDGQSTDAVFRILANNITFEGLTITGGFSPDDGGAIRCFDHDLTVRACRFESNIASDDGGAIAIQDAALLAEDCEFVGNSTFGSTGNSAGGAIQSVRGDITLRRCLFEVNASVQGGGALQIADTDARYRVESCVFRGNTSGVGGAIWWLNAAEGDVFDSAFEGNTAAEDGGAVAHHAAPASYTRCVFTGNRTAPGTGDDGGALFIIGETTNEVVMTSCLIVGNTATSSGGAMNIADGPDPSFLNCTIVGNASLGSGAGVNTSGANAAGFYRNCIVRGNVPGQFSGPAGVFNSNVQGGAAGTGVIDADPLFADAPGGDYRLLDGSPSIDAGNANFYSTQAAPTDLDGQARAVTAADAPAGLPLLGLHVDQGAFEFQPAVAGTCPGDADGNGVVNVDDVDAFVQSFVSGCD